MSRKAGEIADEVLAKIEGAGWSLHAEEVPAGKPAGRRVEALDHPGLKLTAAKGGKVASTVIVRDWSADRAKLEAACLLARHLDVRIAA